MVALRGGRLWAGGSSTRRMGALVAQHGDIVSLDAEIGPDEGIALELGDQLVVPGFQDAHVHPILAGLDIIRCNLEPARNRKEALAAIARYAQAEPGGEWIIGGGWRYDWFEGGVPTAAELDRLTGNRPTYLVVADGHSGWANTAALDRAGIDADTPDPFDGRIERREDQSPQGTLHEGAMDLVANVLPPTTPAELDRALLAGQKRLVAEGVTAWQDAMVAGDDLAAYLRAGERGDLIAIVRGAYWWDRHAGLEQLDRVVEYANRSAGRYQGGSVKLMLDGVCENFTASMLDPYERRSDGGSGIDFIDPTELGAIVTALDRAGLQCHFHAIGDAAVRHALDAVEMARTENGHSDLRHHIAHIQVIHPDDLPRFAELDVIANCQPLWACGDHSMTELTMPYLGVERSGWQYPFGSLSRLGARLAMGSDWPVTSPNVPAQLATFVSRQDRDDRSPFLPDEAVGLDVALAAATYGGAYVNHLDAGRGSIRLGNVCDLAVLSHDPFVEGGLRDVKVDYTIVSGEVVYERKG